ncbi:hypothetical protein F4775DRAFT_595605 [Biscogniauxia sp. FL1348]|nr:hypothetical protein F4775DRAFT_595605 [Biscogniauxia sp. FL1348]
MSKFEPTGVGQMPKFEPTGVDQVYYRLTKFGGMFFGTQHLPMEVPVKIEAGIEDLFETCLRIYGKYGMGSLETEYFWKEVWLSLYPSAAYEDSAHPHEHLCTVVRFYAKARETFMHLSRGKGDRPEHQMQRTIDLWNRKTCTENYWIKGEEAKGKEAKGKEAKGKKAKGSKKRRRGFRSTGDDYDQSMIEDEHVAKMQKLSISNPDDPFKSTSNTSKPVDPFQSTSNTSEPDDPYKNTINTKDMVKRTFIDVGKVSQELSDYPQPKRRNSS